MIEMSSEDGRPAGAGAGSAGDGLRCGPWLVALLLVPWALGLAYLLHAATGPLTVWVLLAATTLLTALLFTRLILLLRQQQLERERLHGWVERFNVATAAGRVGVWDWNVRTGEVLWSENNAHVHGLEPGAFDGTFESWRQRVHPEDLPRVEVALREALEGRDEYRTCLRFLGSDGWRWIDASGQVHRDEQGQPLRMVGAGVDVTARKRAEQEAAESGAFLAHLLDSSPVIVWRCPLDSHVPDWVSGNAARITGYAAGDLSGGLDWLERVHPDDRERVSAAFARVAEDGHAECEVRFQHADGRWLCLRGVLRAEAGAVIGYTADVTVQRRAEQRALRYQRLEAVGRLISGVAHDFNNLLTAAAGYGQLARRDLPDTVPAAQALDEQGHVLEQVAGLVEHLLSFTARREDAPGPVDLGRAVGELGDELARLARDGVEVQLDLPEEPVHVSGIAHRLQQAVLHLAENACDAMPEGGTLRIALRRTTLTRAAAADLDLVPGEYARLEVADTGRGMSPAVVQQIFEPFFSTKPVGHGVGLGLSRVYGIVTSAGGRIDADSEAGSGATFTILLPALRAETESGSHQHAGRQPASPTCGKQVVLLVEDQEQVRGLLASFLTDAGYDVLAAADGHEALELAAGRHLDLLLTDVVLPHLNGRELARRLRADRPSLRVVYMSGYLPEGLQDLEGDHGEHPPFLQKPFRLDELVTTLRSVDQCATRQ